MSGFPLQCEDITSWKSRGLPRGRWASKGAHGPWEQFPARPGGGEASPCLQPPLSPSPRLSLLSPSPITRPAHPPPPRLPNEPGPPSAAKLIFFLISLTKWRGKVGCLTWWFSLATLKCLTSQCVLFANLNTSPLDQSFLKEHLLSRRSEVRNHKVALLIFP